MQFLQQRAEQTFTSNSALTHRVAAHPGMSGSPETGVPAEGRGPSSRATIGPQCAPVDPCALPPAKNT